MAIFSIFQYQSNKICLAVLARELSKNHVTKKENKLKSHVRVIFQLVAWTPPQGRDRREFWCAGDTPT